MTIKWGLFRHTVSMNITRDTVVWPLILSDAIHYCLSDRGSLQNSFLWITQEGKSNVKINHLPFLDCLRSHIQSTIKEYLWPRLLFEGKCSVSILFLSLKIWSLLKGRPKVSVCDIYSGEEKSWFFSEPFSGITSFPQMTDDVHLCLWTVCTGQSPGKTEVVFSLYHPKRSSRSEVLKFPLFTYLWCS